MTLFYVGDMIFLHLYKCKSCRKGGKALISEKETSIRNSSVAEKSVECRSVGLDILFLSLGFGMLSVFGELYIYTFTSSEYIVPAATFVLALLSVIFGTLQYIRYYDRYFYIYSDGIEGNNMPLPRFKNKSMFVPYSDITSVKHIKILPLIALKTKEKTLYFPVPRKGKKMLTEAIRSRISA